MDPWNNVSITFDISRDAAEKLKQLSDRDDIALRNLGILSVQFDGQPSALFRVAKRPYDAVSGSQRSIENSVQLNELVQTARKNVAKVPSTSTDEAVSRPDFASSKWNVAQYLGHTGLSSTISSSSGSNGPVDISNETPPNVSLLTSEGVPPLPPPAPPLPTVLIANQSLSPTKSKVDSLVKEQSALNQMGIKNENLNNGMVHSNRVITSVNQPGQIPFGNMQYTIHAKPGFQNAYTGHHTNTPSTHPSTHPSSSLPQTSPTQPTMAGSSLHIQSNYLNHSNHVSNQQLIAQPSNQNHLHSQMASQLSPAHHHQLHHFNSNTQQSPQRPIQSPNVQQVGKGASIQISSLPSAMNQKSPPRSSAGVNSIGGNHTIYTTTSPSIKAPYIRNPNLSNNIRIGVPSISAELVSKVDSRYASLSQPNTTIMTVSSSGQQSSNHTIVYSTSNVSNINNLTTVQHPVSTQSSNSSVTVTSPTTSNSSCASNVALTSPLLVNLLQSDVSSDHNNSSSSSNASSNSTLVSTSPLTNNHKQGATVPTVISNHHQQHVLVQSPALKEPIAKKAKVKKSRKPKDKPPDQEQGNMSVINSGVSTFSSLTYDQGVPTATTMASTGIKLPTSDVSQSRLLQNHMEPLNQLVQNTNLVITSSSSSSSLMSSSSFDSNKQEMSSQPNISIVALGNDSQTIECNSLRLFSTSSNNCNFTTSINNNSTSVQRIHSPGSAAIVTQTESNLLMEPTLVVSNASDLIKLNSMSLLDTSSNFSKVQNTISVDGNVKSIQLPQKKSDSFLSLPSPVEENKTKHLINPFTGHMEPMMSEDDDDEMLSNSVVNNPLKTESRLHDSKLNDCKDNPSDTDSGIGKMTNDGSSQSSSEISPMELTNTISVNELLNKPVDIINDLHHRQRLNAAQSMIGTSQPTSIAFIPTLLDQETSIQPLNARVPSLACELISETTGSLLSDDKIIVNVNEMLTSSIDKEVLGDHNLTSFVEANFVDGLLNHTSSTKLNNVFDLHSGLGGVEGEICTLISDSACSGPFEMIVDEPSKVLNEVSSLLDKDQQKILISTLTNSNELITLTAADFDDERTLKSSNVVTNQIGSEQMMIDGAELDGLQVTVQFVEDGLSTELTENSSCAAVDETMTTSITTTSTNTTNALNNLNNLTASEIASTPASISSGELCLLTSLSPAQYSGNSHANDSMIETDDVHQLEGEGQFPQSPVHSVASGDHNYTNLKRNPFLNHSTKLYAKPKKVNS